jgi:membrane fusion protein (multidrug efflux system)
LERHCRSAGLLAVVIVALSISTSCSRAAEDEGESAEPTVPTISASTAQVTRKTVSSELVVRGSITALPNEDVKVSAQVAGRVDALTVAEGDTVRQGQVIARIDTRTLLDQQRQAAASRQQAAAQLENAQLNLTRNEQLFSRGIAAGKEVEDAKMAVAQAQAALEQANAAGNTAALQIDRANIRAPIAGQVVKRMVSVGEQVDGTAAQPVVEIANLARVELAANVPASELSHVATGQSVQVTTDTYPDRRFAGTIVALAPAVDPATNTTLVRIRIDNPDRLLKVGMFAEGHVSLEAHINALVVPQSALVRDDAGAAVYVVNGDTATRTTVTTGIEQDGVVELLGGVSDSATVLTSGVHGLGDSVKIAKPE